MSNLSESAPLLAIILPVYKHSMFLIDALESVLRQRSDMPLVVLIVNDGCPFEETNIISIQYAHKYTNEVVYLKKKNGGLSSARNCGINYVLNFLPSVKAIYFLDADNMLSLGALKYGYNYLMNDESIYWVYPSIDMFGISEGCTYPDVYSRLLHRLINICEAGSMVKRSLFLKGILFDENMKLGYEDWEFWLNAASQGMKGKFLSGFGFNYRKRPESMVSNSKKHDNEIQAYIKNKHKEFFFV